MANFRVGDVVRIVSPEVSSVGANPEWDLEVGDVGWVVRIASCDSLRYPIRVHVTFPGRITPEEMGFIVQRDWWSFAPDDLELVAPFKRG